MELHEEQQLPDLNSDENFFLEDFDSYWMEINDRLTVSRMVYDSIIRGVAKAISHDAMDCISAKDDEISQLNARLYDALNEQEMQFQLEREIYGIVLQDFMKDLEEERSNYFRHRIIISDIRNEHRLEKVVDLMNSIKELDSIKSVLSNISKENPKACCRTECDDLKRLLERSTNEKSEEIFKLKRECLNEKGSFQNKRGKFQELKLGFDIIEESGKFFSEVESRIDEQKRRLDKTLNEFNLMSKNLISSVSRLDKVIHENQEQSCKLATALNALEEIKRENGKLSQTIELREKAILSAERRVCEVEREMESMIKHVHEHTRSVDEFHSGILAHVQVRNFRLEGLNYQLGDLFKAIDNLKGRESFYLKTLEMRTSALQKAEAEVDVLGDEVDALVGILEKIYKALDYYAPVLLHYPGVMDTLKLLKKKLKQSI